jgi:hypothetical protein
MGKSVQKIEGKEGNCDRPMTLPELDATTLDGLHQRYEETPNVWQNRSWAHRRCVL